MPRFRPLRFPRPSCFTALAGLAMMTTPAAGAVPERVDFNFHVKPILSDRCYYCHGPDDKHREGKLRLDRAEDAFRPLRDRPGWQIIKPGDPAHSSLMERIHSSDALEVMPPPESKLSLTGEEKAILEKWILQGAEWKSHWALLPVASPPVPAVPPGGNAIDGFVSAALTKTGHRPQPEASREKLLRRASFALTGLPPSPAELQTFLADPSPEFLAKALDRLLASPAFGERMAVDWCDIARYADTYGYQTDRHREVWPWRDWVIRAFNENLPYDRFITWQIAGDLLENPTRDQLIATAFNRLHRQTNEGGSVNEEFRVEYVNDRVITYGTAFLGLTLECSRCHDHKYDPVSSRDYYSLFAFFQNINESGLYSHFTNATPTPAMRLSTPAQDQQAGTAEAAVRAAEQELAALRDSQTAAFETWLATRPAILPVPDCTGDFAFESLENQRAANLADPAAPASAFENPEITPGKTGNALLLDGENGVNLPPGGKITRDDPFSITCWLKSPDRKERAVVFHRSRAWTDAGSQGFELLIEDGRLTASLIHFWPGNAISIRTISPVPPGEWTHVSLLYDGSSRAAGLALHVNGRPADCETVQDHLDRSINESGVGEITIGQRFRDRGFKGGAVDEFKVFTRRLTAPETARLAGSQAESSRESLFDYWLSAVCGPARDLQQSLTENRRRRSAAVDSLPELMIMRELPRPKPAFVLTRGAYDSRGEAVTAGVPAAIMPLDPSLPSNRLGLAQWTTDPRNPLPARVAVNRLWAQMFGRGIVATPEDFGNQGSLPSHPELLDWLAAEFVRSGWNVKHLLKTIALSATWRQDSRSPLTAEDPDNVLLARGPRFRLPAEMIRDNALTIAGLLVSKTGGPSVKPYQPEGIWEEKGGGWSYQPDKGEGLYRRSLYTYWKRTAPPPAMETFDAAKREVCTARRQVTATPLQALVLLNDVQQIEAARVTAGHLLTAGSPAEAIRMAFQHCTSRLPSEAELQVLLKFHAGQLAHFQAHPDEAARLIKNGDTPAGSADPAALAGMTLVVSTLLNHAECVTLR